MHQDSLIELEADMLKKRLKYLRARQAAGKPVYRPGDDCFKQMKDHWTFCSALSDIYAEKEMQEQRRDADVAATLPSSKNEAWHKAWDTECDEAWDGEEWWLDEKYQGPTDDEVRAHWERLEAEDEPQEAIDHFKRLEAEVEIECELAELRDRLDD